MNDIRKKQIEFQRLLGYPVDSLVDSDRNEMAEKYLFKAIEEIIELRREFPSVVNPWSKHQKEANIERVKEEFADVLLFLMNFANVWKLSDEDIIDTIKKVQINNFNKIKEAKLEKLNGEMLKIPGYTIGVGWGSLNPKYIFVGMNPGKDIPHGYKVWSNVEDGSSRVLLPIVESLGILEESYFTNYCKSTTIDNERPNSDLTEFWIPYLKKEVNLLKTGNQEAKVIAMGNDCAETLYEHDFVIHKISHPAAVLRGSRTKDQLKKEIQNALG